MLKNLDDTRRTNKVTLTDIADFLELRYQTVSEKINGDSSFKFDEALLIKKKFFPEYDIEWLFANDDLQEVEFKIS